MIKRSSEDKTVKHLDAFLGCRLINLDKQPSARHIIVKIMIKHFRWDVLTATGSLQLGAWQDAGSEAAIHAIYEMFNEENTEAVLIVDASKTFDSINLEA